MEAVAKGILAAREEIFITDWWLSPEIALIRPYEDDSMRLDNLLGKRAVDIFLLFFQIKSKILGRRNSCLYNGI
jgi:phospholipase D1/2